jgi:hypothetical protein
VQFLELRVDGVLGSRRMLRKGKWTHPSPSQMLLDARVSDLALAVWQRAQYFVVVLRR